MPPPGIRLRGFFRSCHVCKLRKVRCVYPEGQEICERCRDGGVQCIAAVKTARKSNWGSSVDEENTQGAPADGKSEDDIQSLPASPHSLPNYIKPIPAHLSTSRISYLREMHAFTIPDDEIRDTILESYFEFHHPSMPLIQPYEFAESIRRNASDMSLLLLQSTLFVGSTYVNSSVAKKMGLSSVREVRKVFFERARLLHEFNYEDNQYTLAQASLLLSNWYEPPERKETPHWLGCAMSAMQTLPKHTLSASKANRRLWWSIYLRDRSLNWSSRVPLRLHAEDYHVPELVLEDFFTKPSGFAESQFVRNPEDQEDNALICMELIKLHTSIAEFKLWNPGKQEPTVKCQSDALVAELLKWPSRLSDKFQYFSPAGVIRSRCISIQLSLMHLIYWASIMEYCEVLPPDSALPFHISEHITSAAALSNHTIEVAIIMYQHLRDSHYMSYLHLAGMVVMSRCIAYLIRQIETLSSLNNFTFSRHLVELMDGTQTFRSMYEIVDHIFKVFCLRLKQIILRDVTQVLFLDRTELSAWNLENSDSVEEIDRLYRNIRLVLLRLDTGGSIPSLPANSFYTPPSSSLGRTPDSTRSQPPMASSTPGSVPTSTSKAINDSLSSFSQQTPYLSDCSMNENPDVPLDSGIDTPELMSMQQFEEFCNLFGLTEELRTWFS